MNQVQLEQLVNGNYKQVKKKLNVLVPPRYNRKVENDAYLIYDPLGYFCGIAWTEMEAKILVTKLRIKFSKAYNY